MTNKTITLACCTCGKPTACGKMICEECCYEPLPVPPAGGEVVIRQYRVVRPDPRDTPYSAWFEIESAEKDQQISRSLRVTEGQGTPPLYEVRELVDRAQVTRLQAEVAEEKRLRACAQGSNAAWGMTVGLAETLLDDPSYQLHGLDWDYEHTIHGKIAALQSELTKARELLAEGEYCGPARWQQKVAIFLQSNQSAPADKGVI